MSALALLLAAASVFMSALLFSRVQDERERNIRTGCLASNDRNRDTKLRLDRELLKRVSGRQVEDLKPWQVADRLKRVLARAPADRRRMVQQSRASTSALIDALSPVRDCEHVVSSQVRTP